MSGSFTHKSPLIPSDNKAKESILEPAPQEVTEKDFEVFYQQEDTGDAPSSSPQRLPLAQVSSNQEAINVPEGMGFEEKTPDLMALLNAHAGGNILIVAVVPRPLTPAATHTLSV